MNPVNHRLTDATYNLERVANYSQGPHFNLTRANRTVQIALRILDNEFLGRRWNAATDKPQIDKIKEAIAVIKQNNNSFYQNSDLSILEEKVDILAREGIIKTTFNAESLGSSLSERLQVPFRFIFELLTKQLAGLIRHQVYYGWKNKIKNNEIKKLVEQDYEARYNNWYKNAMERAGNGEQKDEVQDIYQQEMAQIQQQVAQNDKVRAIIELEKKAEETRQLFMDIGGERVQLKTADKVKLDGTYLSCDEFKYALQEQKGYKAAYHFASGESLSGISIEPDDPNTNRGLVEKLKELGLLATDNKPGSGYGLLYDPISTRYVIASKENLQNLVRKGEISFNGNSCVYEFQQNRLPYEPILTSIPTSEDERQQILQAGGRLQEIHVKGQKTPIPAFSHLPALLHCPQGFISIRVPSERGGFQRATYYISEDKAEELVRTGVLKRHHTDYHWTNLAGIRGVPAKNPDNWKIPKDGVAILSSGNAGVYEMHKGEALSLLMNGCDVMMVNLRGYGGSEGEPSVQGNYHDLEAAYQFVKEKKGLPDKKITAWALCLSGGMAAHLAERHPHINLFLNQTYAEFWNVLKPNIESTVETFLKNHIYSAHDRSQLRNAIKKCLLPLVTAAVKLLAPNYNVKDRLANIKGKICVMQATDDTLMTRQETTQMQSAIRGKNVDCKFVDIPGEHCTPWNQVATYKTPAGKEVKQDDYAWIVLDGVNPIFLPLEDLQSPNGCQLNGLNASFSIKVDPQGLVAQ